MRVWSRIALVALSFVFTVVPLSADHFQADCPLSLADSTPPATSFDLSPHGIFRSGNLVYALRGQVLTTYAPNDVGSLAIVREDFLGSLGARETEGGVAFGNGHLFISSEAGLEIYDLRNVRQNGSAPVRVSRTPGLHYRRMSVNGNQLAGLYPASDMPCHTMPSNPGHCATYIDIIDVTSLTTPTLVGRFNSTTAPRFSGLNDIAFNSGHLIVVGERGLFALDTMNPGGIREIASVLERPGQWLVSNSNGFIAVGKDHEIDTYDVRPGLFPFFLRTAVLPFPGYLTIEHANPLRFSRHAYWDEANARLVTMIDEVNPMTLKPARTIAFDVFDLLVPRYEGSAERVYEEVTLTTEDEVKYNPVSVGGYVYVVGEESGIQTWGACGVATGRIELDSPTHLTCGGAQIYGWVTGTQRIVNVELFLDNQVLGAASLGGPLRNEVSSSTPVLPWRVNVNLDQRARGEYQLRAVATDSLGNRRQFAMKRLFLEGPGRNCTVLRRRAVR